jgi:transcriptional regulator with GAF, ATPase, and Fis domain
LQSATRSFQRRFVLEALERSDWNIAEAAESLDIARSYLYALIRALGIKRRERADLMRRPRASEE